MTKRQLAASKQQAAQLGRRTFLQKAGAVGIVALVGFTLSGLVSALGRFLHSAHPSGAAASLPDTGAPSRASPATSGYAPRRHREDYQPGRSDDHRYHRPERDPDRSSGGCPGRRRRHLHRPGAAGPRSGRPGKERRVPRFFLRSAPMPVARCSSTGRTTSSPARAMGRFSAQPRSCPQGPAPTGLSPIPVALGPNGQLYVDG